MSALLLQYRGRFADPVTEGLVGLTEAALAEAGLDKVGRLRVRSLLVEMVQNVQRWSAEPATGLVELRQEQGLLRLSTVNPVDDAARERLEARLAALAALDPEGLRAAYRAALRGPADLRGMSTGLGLLFVCQQTARPLESVFRPAGEGRWDFELACFVACRS